VQRVHHCREFSGNDFGEVIQRQCQRIVDCALLVRACGLQHVADDGTLVTRMADADAQTREEKFARAATERPLLFI
jgi:hypothetical protein